MATNYLQQIAAQINQITESLDGTITQIEAMNRKIEENSKGLTESITAVNENMRLIIEVIKKGRSNTKETLEDIRKNLEAEIQKINLESITKDEILAVKKLKDINNDVSENLYMAQLLNVIQGLREITGRAMAIKLKKDNK
ncbi:hypothetical protein DSAG12_00122 [Promethearchaeum syntrophicum]|uniref:Uncharacterized protein n=1 Tax=Promethearchaeum syntrophicum TaxID=2594042 RepID=A0A5B9D651_9ARCH|nr:hypothetical protein [Candidatus Prometheoarchaeum syntrophicum]QEE14310.1 hypothetical protein DSAG12_00122 [Candidatus Prometheoarchaeum syntrophicum]